MGTSVLKIELKILSGEKEKTPNHSSPPFKEKEKGGEGRSKAWWPKECSNAWWAMEEEEKGSHAWWPMEGEEEGFHAWWPMEGQEEGSHAWWPMEGEREGSFSPLPTFPPSNFT